MSVNRGTHIHTPTQPSALNLGSQSPGNKNFKHFHKDHDKAAQIILKVVRLAKRVTKIVLKALAPDTPGAQLPLAVQRPT